MRMVRIIAMSVVCALSLSNGVRAFALSPGTSRPRVSHLVPNQYKYKYVPSLIFVVFIVLVLLYSIFKQECDHILSFPIHSLFHSYIYYFITIDCRDDNDDNNDKWILNSIMRVVPWQSRIELCIQPVITMSTFLLSSARTLSTGLSVEIFR